MGAKRIFCRVYLDGASSRYCHGSPLIGTRSSKFHNYIVRIYENMRLNLSATNFFVRYGVVDRGVSMMELFKKSLEVSAALPQKYP